MKKPPEPAAEYIICIMLQTQAEICCLNAPDHFRAVDCI